MKLITEDMIEAKLTDIGEMVSQYFDFISHNHRDFSPLSINESYIVKAHYHQEEGRGGYFAPESGTSEGQFLVIRSLLETYLILKESKYLNLAIELMDASLKILYQGWEMPDKVDEDNLWLPHWLFNASEPFVAEAFYLYEKVKFTNGVGKLTMGYEAREVYTVRALDAQLEWENPYSKIIGKEYKIKNYTLAGNTATITLEEKFTGEAYVTAADLGGPIIEHNECYEAWAIWRKLTEGETACAVDSLWWVYDCFRLLAQCVPDNPFYEKARAFTLETIEEVMKVSNMGDWHVTDFKTGDPFASVGLYVWQDRYPEVEITRDKNDGAAIIDVKEGRGQVQYGKGGIGIKFEEHNSVEVKISSDTDMTVTFFIAPYAGAAYEDRYTAYVKLKGDEVVRKYTLTHEDFIKKTDLIWDCYFLPEYSDEEIYRSTHSTVKVETVENEKGRTFKQISLIRGMETDGLYEYVGWAQYQPLLHEDRFDFMSIPNYYVWLKTGNINLRITDAKGYYWETPVPRSTSYLNFCPKLSDFTLSGHQNVTGNPTAISFPLKELLFDSVEDSVFRLGHIGDIGAIPAGTNINDFVFETNKEEAHKIKLFYSRPLPLEGYEYTPYVAPFTVNTVNRHLDTWRGTPYTGYQCPWIWQEMNKPEGVTTVLDFMERAQREYTESTGVEGFFMPLFIWDRWDSREYGEPNTFSFNGPDPNTHWGGFQYRGIETVARTYFNDPSNTRAKKMVLKFITAVDNIWTETGHYPVTFAEGEKPVGDYREPHMVALLLRTCIFYYQTTKNAQEEELCVRLMRQCVAELLDLFHPFSEIDKWNSNFINGTWSTTNNEWYMFWGGEILSALALLMKYSTSEFVMKTRYGLMKVETFPDIAKLTDYVKVKTPIGIQKVKLVATNEETASPLRVMTKKGLMAIGGVKIMSGLSKEVKLLVQNEGYALKPVEVIQESQTLDNEAGALKIMNIKGKTMKNHSPRRSYDYGTEGNWGNYFGLVGGQTYHLTFDITTPRNTILTIVFKKEDGSDFGWMDIDSMAEEKTLHFGFPTSPEAVGCMLYLQSEGDCVIDNIMLLEGTFEHGVPNYFENTVSTCKDGLLVAVRDKDGIDVDTIQLADVIPNEYFPLHSDGVTSDEIVGNVLYKRFDSDGNKKEEEEVVLLNDFIALLEAPRGCSLILEEATKVYPNMDIRYPVNFEQYVKSLLS